MPLLRPLDPAFPIDRQLAVDATPVVLVNLVTLDKADEPRFLEAWQHDAAFMKRQPGFISTQLHRAIGDSPTYFNYAVWGVDGSLPHRLHASGVQGRPRRVSVLRGRHPAPLSDGRRARHLCGLGQRHAGRISEAAASRQEGARIRTTAAMKVALLGATDFVYDTASLATLTG